MFDPKKLIFPCCKKKIPDPIFPADFPVKPDFITCPCGQSFSYKVIVEYNQLFSIVSETLKMLNKGYAIEMGCIFHYELKQALDDIINNQ